MGEARPLRRSGEGGVGLVMFFASVLSHSGEIVVIDSVNVLSVEAA
jgi:hypothetical protein